MKACHQVPIFHIEVNITLAIFNLHPVTEYQELELQPSERFGTSISINYMKLFYLDILPNLIHVTFLKSDKNISPVPLKKRIVFFLTLGQI